MYVGFLGKAVYTYVLGNYQRRKVDVTNVSIAAL